MTRGVCKVGQDQMLEKIVETHNIVKDGEKAKVITEGGEKYIDVDSPVSMNMWGLQPEFFEVLEQGFAEFLEKLDKTDLKTEYLLPTIIGGLLEEDKVEVKVLKSQDKWFGVTYKEDKESVVQAIKGLIARGEY